MHITVGNIWAACTQAAPAEIAWLRAFLKLPPRDYGRERVLFLSPSDTRFYAGLVSLVQRHSPTPVTTARAVPRKLRLDPGRVGWLFDYQRAALEAVDTHARGVIEIPTGGGKGEVMVGMAAGFGGTGLVLSPSVDLMYQAAGRYKLRTGREAGICGDGTWRPDPMGLFTSCTFETLAAGIATQRVQALLNSATWVFADEAHYTPSDMCSVVLVGKETKSRGRVGGLPNAELRVGASGTPFDRSDKRDVLTVTYIGERIYTVTKQELEDRGILAPAEIDFVQVHQPFTIESAEGDDPFYQQAVRKCIVESSVRNVTFATAVLARPGPRLVFVDSVDHGYILRMTFRRLGAVTEFVYGDDSNDVRRDVLDGLAQKRVDVGIATKMWRTGIDVPALMTVGNAAARKSVIELRQGIGRGVRRIDSSGRVVKDKFYVVDIYDKGCRQLQEQAESRMSTLRRLGYPVRITNK